MLGVRLHDALLGPVDAWIAEQDDPKPSRPEVLRRALREWLTRMGKLPHRDDPEMAN